MQIAVVADKYLIHERIVELFGGEELLALRGRWSRTPFKQTLLGRAALKLCVNPQYPTSIVAGYNQLGQPVIEGNDLHCSVSHSYNVGVAAAADQPVGIDVEKVRFHDRSLLSYIAHPEEVTLFEALSPDVLVTQVWVLKESVQKAIGHGLPLADIVIARDKTGFVAVAQGTSWRVACNGYGEYYIGYCYPLEAESRITINTNYYI